MLFKRKTGTTYIILIVIVALLSVGFVTYAAHIPAFGGFVLATFPCSCTLNFLLVISPPKGGLFIYSPFAPPLLQAFLNFNLPRPGLWALGFYIPGGICLTGVPPFCVPLGITGTIKGTILPIVGTSL